MFIDAPLSAAASLFIPSAMPVSAPIIRRRRRRRRRPAHDMCHSQRNREDPRTRRRRQRRRRGVNHIVRTTTTAANARRTCSHCTRTRRIDQIGSQTSVSIPIRERNVGPMWTSGKVWQVRRGAIADSRSQSLLFVHQRIAHVTLGPDYLWQLPFRRRFGIDSAPFTVR